MTKLIVADAGPLIAFGRINRIDLLISLFTKIMIPQAVAMECFADIARPGAQAIQDAVKKRKIKVVNQIDYQPYQALLDYLGPGEAASIALALQSDVNLLIDEKLGRSAANKLGLKIIGTAGVLVLAKHKHLLKSISPLINQLKGTGYYLSDSLTQSVLTVAGE